jgi:hypothetical protein
MWWTLKNNKISTKYVTLIEDMYMDVVTCIITCDSVLVYFILEYDYKNDRRWDYIFTLVMDEIMRGMQKKIIGVLFANDMVLIRN